MHLQLIRENKCKSDYNFQEKKMKKKMNNWVILQVEFPDHVERKKTSAPTHAEWGHQK